MKEHPWFENWRVGPEWTSHDDAFWDTWRITFTRGEYWFFLFNSLGEGHKKVCVLVNKLGKKHVQNRQHIKYEALSPDHHEWRNNTSVWYYLGGEVKELFMGMSRTRVAGHRLESEHPSGHRVAFTGEFPNYTLTINKGAEEIGHFQTKGTRVTELRQSPILKMRSKEGFSPNRDTFAKIDRVSQPPYCASNCCDVFVGYKGRFMGEAFEGVMWVERARSFGLPPNWLLLYVAFDDRSRLWMRHFTGKINHNDPLVFYFDDEKTRNRYDFNQIEWKYYTGYHVGAHDTIRDDTEFVELKGRGPGGEVRCLCELKGYYLHRYTSYKYESRYYQTVCDPVEFEFTDPSGRKVDLSSFKRGVGYGEETYKKKWRETMFADLDDKPR